VVRDERTGKEKRQNSIIIRKGTPIPHRETKTYCTSVPGQSAVSFWITESDYEEIDLRFVNVISKMDLSLAPIPGGRPPVSKIEITFTCGEDQVMGWTILDTETRECMSLTIDIS